MPPAERSANRQKIEVQPEHRCWLLYADHRADHLTKQDGLLFQGDRLGLEGHSGHDKKRHYINFGALCQFSSWSEHMIQPGLNICRQS